MAVYTYSEETIGRLLQKQKWATFWVRIVCAVWLAAFLIVEFVLPFGFAVKSFLPRNWSMAFLVFPLMMLTNGGFTRDQSKRFIEYLRSYSVDVSPYSVRIQSSLGPQRQFLREEITRLEESSWGRSLFLRTANRYRCLGIPRNIDGFSELREELIAAGIPFTKKAIPGNWEDILVVLAFCGSIICDMVSRNPHVLAANIAVASMVGLFGFLIVGANPDDSKRMRWVRLGALLPLLFAIGAFYLSRTGFLQ